MNKPKIVEVVEKLIEEHLSVDWQDPERCSNCTEIWGGEDDQEGCFYMKALSDVLNTIDKENLHAKK